MQVGEKDLNFQGTQVTENGASWACKVGTKWKPFPLVVENLDQPDQMLVEVIMFTDLLNWIYASFIYILTNLQIDS